jgi:cytochrome b561
MLKNTTNTYGIVAKGFHWVLFLMLGFSIVAGNFLASMPKGPEKLQAAGMHKSFGLIILALILARFVWRLINETPKEPDGTSAMQALLATAMHWLLYALMFAQPLSGILMSQAFGYPASLFGIVDFPVLIEKNIAIAKLLREAHGYIWIALVAAVIGHAGAAIYHHFIAQDDVLNRMTFGSKS